jgi:hypothetical protein
VPNEARNGVKSARGPSVKHIDTLRALPPACQRDERRMPPRQKRNNR